MISYSFDFGIPDSRMSLNDLRDFSDVDLIEKLQLSDDEFEQNWLVPLGLLNGSMLCECGGHMKEVTNSGGVKVLFKAKWDHPLDVEVQ